MTEEARSDDTGHSQPDLPPLVRALHLTSVPVLVVAALASLIASSAISCCLHDWSWFGRAGSLTTLFGAMLSAREYLRQRLGEMYKSRTTIDGGRFTDPPVDREIRRDLCAAKTGFGFVVFGTVISGYGDQVGKLGNFVRTLLE